MASTIKLKRSAVADAIPLITDLVEGELALNVLSGRLYTRDDDDNVVAVGEDLAQLSVDGAVTAEDVILTSATAGAAQLRLSHTGAPLDEKTYRISTGNGTLGIFIVNDADSNSQDCYTIFADGDEPEKHIWSIGQAGKMQLDSTGLLIDVINERLTEVGVTIEGVLLKNGFVGVGDDAPLDRLTVGRLGSHIDVLGANANTAVLVHPGGGTSSSGALITVVGGAASVGTVGLKLGTVNDANRAGVLYNAVEDRLQFGSGANDARMVIDASGDVGIGTTNPSRKFEVAGNTGNPAFKVAPFGGNVTLYSETEGQSSGRTALVIDALSTQIKSSGGVSITFASSGNTGVGETNPTELFHVNKGTTGRVPSTNSRTMAAFQYNTATSDSCRVLILAGNASTTAGLLFGDEQDEDVGAIIYNHSADSMTFRVNGDSGVLNITSAGHILFGVSGLPTGTENGWGFNNSSGYMQASRASSSAVNQITFHNPNGIVGSVQTNGSATAYNTSSDYRLKNVFGPIQNSGSYIDSLNPVEGTWKADGSAFVGLIAHEAQAVSRTPVATGEKDAEEMQGMDYSSAEIIANLIREVQLLRVRLENLEA